MISRQVSVHVLLKPDFYQISKWIRIEQRQTGVGDRA